MSKKDPGGAKCSPAASHAVPYFFCIIRREKKKSFAVFTRTRDAKVERGVHAPAPVRLRQQQTYNPHFAFIVMGANPVFYAQKAHCFDAIPG